MADEEIWRLLFDDSDDDEVFEGFEQSDRRVVEDCESDVDIDFSNVDVSPVSTPETTDDEDEAVVQPVGAWSSTTTNIPVRNFQQPVGPVHNLPVGATPLDFFNLLLPDTFLETVKCQTNLYAEQRQQQAGKVDPKWTPITLKEVKLFLAIGIMMGIHKLPRQKLYWARDDALNVSAVSKLMCQNRYEKISQYLHLNDNTKFVPRGQPQHDPLFKIRPLITLTEEKFTQYYKPNRELSVDEAMVRYNGRLHFKQYIRQKPSPWGIKVWCCADPKTGYLLTYDVYTGKTNHTAPGGLGQHVVMKLSEQYLGKNHHIFFDNYFNSVPLQEELLRNNTYACGTMRVNRKEWPKDLVFNQRTPKHKRLKTGETKMRQRGDMLATVWQDKRTVAVLSTGIQPTMGSASRHTAKEGRHQKEIPTPILTYKKNMGGVDLFDQHRSYYTLGRQSRKWWRYLLWFLLEAVVINSSILFRMSNMPFPKRSKLHDSLYFRMALYHGLVKNNVVTKRQQQQPESFLGHAISDPTEHQVVKLVGRAKNCVLCQKEKRRTEKGRGVQSTFGCTICKVNLCKGECFARFHAQLLQ